MKIYEEVIVSEKIKYDKKELLEKIIRGDILHHTYLIGIPLWECENQLEIYHEAFHSQVCYRNMDLLVIGIALGYGDALELVKNIASEVVENTGTANIKEYYLEKMELEKA